MSLNRFTGRVALVTGAARPRGIGRATALRLAEEGADVACLDLARPMEGFADHGVAAPDDLDSVVAEIEAMGRRAVAVRADVTDEALVEAAVKDASEALGTITMVANVAGGASVGMGLGPLCELPVAQFDQVIALNLRSVFLVTSACVRRMLGEGVKGGVVNVSSQTAKRGSPNLGAYCAAKAGVILLTQSFAVELGGSGINVNAVCPGLTDTDLVNKNNQMEEMFGERAGGFDEWVAGQIPLGRIGTADDVAGTIAWLLSEDASYITGEATNVSGGQTMG